MTDIIDPETGFISRVKIENHQAFGEKVAEWSTDPSKRPPDLQALKDMLVGVLTVPDRFTDLVFVDVPLNTLVIRVPNKDMVEESQRRFTATSSGRYPLPVFYNVATNGDGQIHMAGDALLYHRIADYTIAQCV